MTYAEVEPSQPAPPQYTQASFQMFVNFLLFFFVYFIFVRWQIMKGYLDAFTAAAAAKSIQSCLTLCDPIDGSLPGSPVPGILQARILEWVAISFSNAWFTSIP